MIPDAPEIRETERTGYPYPQIKLCPWCGEDAGDKTYNIEGENVCVDCFTEWLQDYLHTNPDDVAAALSVPVKYEG